MLRGSGAGVKHSGSAGERRRERRNSDAVAGGCALYGAGAQLGGGGVGAAMEKRFDVWGSWCLCMTGRTEKA